MAIDAEAERIDARGLRCPLPVLKLEKTLDRMTAGQSLQLLADDPIAKLDVPLFCKKHGHACTMTDKDGATEFAITKSSD